MKQFNNLTIEPIHFEELYPEKTRFEQIKKIIDILRTGRSAQVVGLPGVGKSNVLRLLPYNKQLRTLHLGDDESKWHFVYMDFSEVRGRDFFELIKFIFISLSYSLGEREFGVQQEKVNQFLKEALEFNDELILFQGLKRSIDYLAIESGLYIVFMFDRFEDYIPNISDKFFLNLKILRNRVKYNFLAVFGVTRPIEDVLEPVLFGEFYEFIVGNTVYLPIKDEQGLEFRFSYLEKITGKQADKKIKEEIEKITAGDGKLVKLAYEAVLAEVLPAGRQENIENLEELLLSKKQIRGSLFEIWNFLTPEEQRQIKAPEVDEFLEKIGLTNEGKITIPLFSSYLSTLTTQTINKISYDHEKNEITKGEENLTDKLTPSEFKLLRFLITNAERVCEKDEIIAAVWKDSKTQEGVSDQALDQIIYRLRKKVEDDPNNPHFIHTVKGRGYKFEN
jgi:DNA-binding winged helix-turn-helix (wHTH) protein